MTKSAFSTLEQRVKWLLAHRWALIGKFNRRKVITAMKHDGLVSKLTYWPDVKGIEDAVAQAKRRWYAEHNGRDIRP